MSLLNQPNKINLDKVENDIIQSLKKVENKIKKVEDEVGKKIETKVDKVIEEPVYIN